MRVRQALLLTATAAAVLLAGPIAAQEWKKYSYLEDGFEVEFPAAPKITPVQMSEEIKARVVRANQLLHAVSTDTYVVGASLNRYSTNFDKGVKDSYETAKCKTTVSERDISRSDVLGREVIGTSCVDDTFRVEARYYTKENWFYQAITFFKENGGDAASARRFLNSFKIY